MTGDESTVQSVTTPTGLRRSADCCESHHKHCEQKKTFHLSFLHLGSTVLLAVPLRIACAISRYFVLNHVAPDTYHIFSPCVSCQIWGHNVINRAIDVINQMSDYLHNPISNFHAPGLGLVIPSFTDPKSCETKRLPQTKRQWAQGKDRKGPLTSPQAGKSDRQADQRLPSQCLSCRMPARMLLL